MADRLYNAQINYPFAIYPDDVAMSGIVDCLFYMSPEDFVATPAQPPALERVGAWLHRRVKAGANWRYTFYVAAPADPDVFYVNEVYPEQGLVYTVRTFNVPAAPATSIVVARASEDDRSVLVVNVEQIEGPTSPVDPPDNLVEPARIVPCTRKVASVSLYNEYRSSDPADRGDLPPDFFIDQILPGQDLVFNDGYNCSVAYNEATATLRFTGGVGFGLGRPTVVPWDDTDENFEEGVRSVNGVNTLGVVPMESGSGVQIDSSVPGKLILTVRNQGDGECPPG